MTTITQEWERFYTECRGPDRDPDRVRELKACFFAGAIVGHQLTLLACLPSLSPEQIKSNLHAIQTETLDYLTTLGKK